MFRTIGACWRACPALLLRDDGGGTCMSVRQPAPASLLSTSLKDEHRIRGCEYGKNIHEITFGTAGTAIRERQAQLVSQCPCLLLLMGFVYPVLVGFVGISGLSRHLGMDLDSNFEFSFFKYFLRNIFDFGQLLDWKWQNRRVCLLQNLTAGHRQCNLPRTSTLLYRSGRAWTPGP